MVTLNELITLAKQRGDIQNSNFVGPEESAFIVNSSAAELYGLLAISYEDYFSDQFDFSITSNDGYILPFMFFKLIDLENVDTGQDQIQYKIMGPKIIVKRSVGNFRMTYIPQYVPMVSSDALLDNMSMQYWYEYIVVDAAIKMMQKEESDTSLLAMQKQQLVHRIEAESANRDANTPMRVNDTRKIRYYPDWEW